MDIDHFSQQMASNAERIKTLVQGVSDSQFRWKPDVSSWSILEVINHLYDEENEDFRVRIEFILHGRDGSWPGIDPEGWVKERRYNERDSKKSLQGFLTSRQESLAWLKRLDSPDWAASYDASFGRITAGDIFASWVMHDLFHMKQIVELHREYTIIEVKPYSVDYAGAW